MKKSSLLLTAFTALAFVASAPAFAQDSGAPTPTPAHKHKHNHKTKSNDSATGTSGSSDTNGGDAGK